QNFSSQPLPSAMQPPHQGDVVFQADLVEFYRQWAGVESLYTQLSPKGSIDSGSSGSECESKREAEIYDRTKRSAKSSERTKKSRGGHRRSARDWPQNCGIACRARLSACHHGSSPTGRDGDGH